MPQQLIYTSAPRGVIAGRSGYCTVARSAAMRDALMLQLEKLSYYQHLSLSGGQERPIFCCRVLDIRGSRYHVLTRIRDAGLDFTGRTNFLAHHLVFSPEEIRQFASPPVILRAWSGWLDSWTQEPKLFENENCSSLTSLPAASTPATNWQQLTGDAANAYGLLEARAGIALRVDNLTDDQALALFAESLELLELRDPRHDFRASRWQFTFTTSMQEQDNPADFRWRCLHSDNPAANRFAGPDSRALTDIRVARTTNEEALFARSGRQPPRFVVPPQNVSVAVNETARLYASAEGVPAPAYQWLAVDRASNHQPIPNATSEELLIPNPPLGITRFAVRATNSEGNVTSDVVVLSVEPKGMSGTRPSIQSPRAASPPTAPHVKSAEDIERQRQRLESERAQRPPIRKWPFLMLGIAFLVLISAAITLSRSGEKKSPRATTVQQNDSSPEMSNLQHPSNAVLNDMAKAAPEATLPETNRAMAFSSGISSPPNPANVPFSDSITELSLPWTPVQIGNKITARTSAKFNNSRGEIIIFGAGQNDYDPSDDFFFVQQPASNSVDFSARLKTAPESPSTRQGIMIRESEKTDAPFVFVGLSQACLADLHREASSQYSQIKKVPGVWFPIFLRLLKQTNFISVAYSTNGSAWVWFETNQISFSAERYLIGFAVSSGYNNTQAKAIFDEVRIKKLSAK
jgi:hypothetical protein